MQQFSEWLRKSNRAEIYRRALEATDKLMDDPKLRGDLIDVIVRHASKAHHETDPDNEK